MIRVVAAVVLAAALVAASLPAVGDARADRTAARLDSATVRIQDAARSLLATDEAVVGERGARRVVTVRLPARSLTSAGVTAFDLDCRRRCTVTARLAGGTVHRRTLGDLPLRTRPGGLRLGRPGVHHLVLELRLVGGRAVVVVRRA